jgi:hypothetical protein
MKHTAKVRNIASANADSRRPYCHAIDAQNPPDPGPTAKFEDLGQKTIDGIEVRGSRTTDYRTMEARGAATNPTRIHEEWCSIALDNPIEFYSYSDNPKRKVTSVFKDIQFDSDPHLFEIPSCYSITETADTSAHFSTLPK